MRRILLFLALFGFGLFCLWLWIRTQEAGSVEPDRPATEASSQEDPFGDEDDDSRPSVPISPDERISLALRGEQEWTGYSKESATGESRALYRVHAKDVVGTDDVRDGARAFEMIDLDIERYDEETGQVVLQLESSSSRMRLASNEGLPILPDEERVELSNVEAELKSGFPLTPLRLQRVPTLLLDVKEGDFESKDFVVFTARGGLEASGQGMRYHAKEERFTIERNARIEVILDPAQGLAATLTVTGTGELDLRARPDLGPDAVELEASSGTELEFTPPFPLTLKSEAIRLVGRSSEQGGAFELSLVEATGGVELERRDGGSFIAERADFEFEGTEVQLVRLTGSPRGDVALGLLDGSEDLVGKQATISGIGPLSVYVQREGFEMQGPGQVVVPELGATIDARQVLRGSGNAAAGWGVITAKGDVQIRLGDRLISSEEMDVRLQSPGSDEERGPGAADVVVYATSPSATRLFGPDAIGRLVTMDAGRGISFRLDGDRVQVERAREVDLGIEGEDGFRFAAGEVRDFDSRSMSWDAFGGVTFDGVSGIGEANGAEVRGLEDVKLLGLPEELATFRLKRGAVAGVRTGTASAESILLEGTQVRAVRSVSLELETTESNYAIRCRELELDLAPMQRGASEETFGARGEDVEEATIEFADGSLTIASGWLEIAGRVEAEPDRPKRSRRDALEELLARAGGGVQYRWAGNVVIEGQGEELRLDAQGKGDIEAPVNERVVTRGRFPGSDLPYEMTADWIEFEPEGLWAGNPRIRVDDFQVPIGPVVRDREKPTVLNATARNLTATRSGLLLSGESRVSGITQDGEDWWVESEFVQLMGSFPIEDGEAGAAEAEPRDETSADVPPDRRLMAWGGFRAALGDQLACKGERFIAMPGLFRIEGEDTELEVEGMRWRSPWIEYDPQNLYVSSDAGLLSAVGDDDWSVAYESLRPFEGADTTILALRHPIFQRPEQQVRADWALFWVDREQWQRTGSGFLGSDSDELRISTIEESQRGPEDTSAPDIFGSLRSNKIAHVLSELFLEGNIEILRKGDRFAHGEAIYIDLVDGHGWIEDASVGIPVEVSKEDTKVFVRADWLRHSADGSLRADNAVLTTCDFEKPHFVIETGDLRLTPFEENDNVYWTVRAKDNALRFSNGFGLPFPSIPEYESNRDGLPKFLEPIRVGDSARNGTEVTGGIRRDLGGTARRWLSAIGFDRKDWDGEWQYNGSYLGSRGVLGGIGLEVTAGDRFWMNMYVDGLRDKGDDKGFIQVDEADRGDWRIWSRARGRYTLDEGEWLDIVYSGQTDAGVQAEFFEREYLRFEERDNFLHWRKADNGVYYDAILRNRVNGFRTEVERLPSVGYFQDRLPIGELSEGGAQVLFSSRGRAEWLRRREGNPLYERTFEDGLGDRQTFRFDNEHRVEVPFDLGAGVRATPFLSARGTFWSHAEDRSESTTRLLGTGGVELGSRYWKLYGDSLYHELAPSISVGSDFVMEDGSEDPVRYDLLDDSPAGAFVQLALRSRLWTPDRSSYFDVELRGTHAADPDVGEDGWRPIGLLSNFRTRIGDIPVGATHDGRYDPDDGSTVYSSSTLAFSPWQDLGLQLGFSRARELDLSDALYEAGSLATVWRATPKWEFEFGQTLDLRSDDDLNTEWIVRRIGHDIVFELEFETRSGEGNAVNFSLSPRLGWRPGRLRYLDTISELTAQR